MAARLKDVERVLDEGGLVRFTWSDGRRELITASGETQRLDGRCYASVRNDPDLIRMETGSTDNKDLVIIWRKF